jgi:hypothetical protein
VRSVIAGVRGIPHPGPEGAGRRRVPFVCEGGAERKTSTGTLQRSTLSPLPADIARSVPHESFAAAWQLIGRSFHRAKNYGTTGSITEVVRYVDDFGGFQAVPAGHADTPRAEAGQCASTGASVSA